MNTIDTTHVIVRRWQRAISTCAPVATFLREQAQQTPGLYEVFARMMASIALVLEAQALTDERLLLGLAAGVALADGATTTPEQQAAFGYAMGVAETIAEEFAATCRTEGANAD